MSLKKSTILILLIFTIFSACSVEEKKRTVDINLTTDPEVLASRVSFGNRSLAINATTAGKTAQIMDAPELTVVTEIATPTVPTGLSAAHVLVDGTRLYVAYHLNDGSGETSFAGGIQVYDFEDEEMVSEATNESIDWNHILLDGASQRLVFSGDSYQNGALLHLVSTNETLDVAVGDNEVINLPGVSANSTVRTANMLIASVGGSGDNTNTQGGLYALDADSPTAEDAKVYAANGLKQVTYFSPEDELITLKENGDQNAELIVFDDNNVFPSGNLADLDWDDAFDVAIDMQFPINPVRGRNAVHVSSNDIVFVPLSSNGIQVVNLFQGANAIVDTESTRGGSVNSITSDDDYVYVCKSTGFDLYERSGSRGAQLDLVAQVDEDEFVADPADIELVSINQAATFSYDGQNYVAVAAGRAGVKIIRISAASDDDDDD